MGQCTIFRYLSHKRVAKNLGRVCAYARAFTARIPAVWEYVNTFTKFETSSLPEYINMGVYLTPLRICDKYRNLVCWHIRGTFFYVRREVDLMKTAKVNAYIMHIFGKIELLSIHAT